MVSLSGRNGAIDALRGVSILAVIMTHLDTAGPFAPAAVIPAGWLNAAKVNGGLGVSLFFTISGFLITQTTFQRHGTLGAVSLREFISFRASRILPLLLLLVGCNLAAAALAAPGFGLAAGISYGNLLLHVFTFRFNVLYVHGGAQLLAWAPLWSLAVEEVFYLAFPLLVLALRRTAALVVVLAAVAVQGYFYRDLSPSWAAYYLYPGCIDQLALGCLAAIAAHRFQPAQWPARTRALLQLAGLVLITGTYFSGDMHQGAWVWMPSAMASGAALFLLGSATPAAPARPGAWRLAWPLRVMGFLSYELYLFHLPLLLLLKGPLPAWSRAVGGIPWDAACAGFLVLVTVGGALLHAAFSDPVQRRLRKVLVPSARSSSLGPLAA